MSQARLNKGRKAGGNSIYFSMFGLVNIDFLGLVRRDAHISVQLALGLLSLAQAVGHRRSLLVCCLLFTHGTHRNIYCN